MRRFGLLAVVVVVMVVLVGCRGLSVKGPPSVKRGIDFNYDAVWQAAMEAVQVHFSDLQYCQKEDRKIESYFKRDIDLDLTAPWEYARRLFLEIVPGKTPDGRPAYDIHVRVIKYWRARNPLEDYDEGWDPLKRDGELEEKILDDFDRMTDMDQRIRQGNDAFEKRQKKGW